MKVRSIREWRDDRLDLFFCQSSKGQSSDWLAEALSQSGEGFSNGFESVILSHHHIGRGFVEMQNAGLRTWTFWIRISRARGPLGSRLPVYNKLPGRSLSPLGAAGVEGVDLAKVPEFRVPGSLSSRQVVMALRAGTVGFRNRCAVRFDPK